MRRRRGYNPKRKIAPVGMLSSVELRQMVKRVSYGGNPEHKKSPGDYNLTPPAAPRPGKTLCDGRGPFLKAIATKLLKTGLSKGMVSPCANDEWPQNIWAVSESGEPFEAELENRTLGVYHGYPMPLADTFRAIVQEEWQKR